MLFYYQRVTAVILYIKYYIIFRRFFKDALYFDNYLYYCYTKIFSL